MGTKLKRGRKTLKEKKQEAKEQRMNKRLIKELSAMKIEGNCK